MVFELLSDPGTFLFPPFPHDRIALHVFLIYFDASGAERSEAKRKEGKPFLAVRGAIAEHF